MDKKCTHELEVFSECPLCKIKELEAENRRYKPIVVLIAGGIFVSTINAQKALEGKD